MKRYVILAMGAVLERETLEMEDYLYRKRLYRALYAFKLHNRKKAVRRNQLANAKAQVHKVVMKGCMAAMRRYVEQRREMRKDAITRQLMEQEAGEDQFFCVQVKIEGTQTARRELVLGDG